MKTVIDPETTRQVVDRTTCDLCSKDICEKRHEINEVTIEMRLGSRYPEGGNVTKTGFDICCECFVAKLIPWLREQGAEPAVTETDF